MRSGARTGVWSQRLASITAAATLPLLFVGGLVTSKGAALAVPDWPTTFGHNMFFYPWSQMVGGIFYEHAHRLVAAAVGLLTVALAAALWLEGERRWIRWLGTAALLLVVLQGVMGGLRVLWLDSQLALAHACLAQAFFALAASLALFTSEEWRQAEAKIESRASRTIQRLALAVTALVYLQVIAGAALRHFAVGLTLHALLAAAIAASALVLHARLAGLKEEGERLRRGGRLFVGLVATQLLLGLASYLGKFAALTLFSGDLLSLITVSHLVIGALLLATGLRLTLRSYRWLAPPAGRRARVAA